MSLSKETLRTISWHRDPLAAGVIAPVLMPLVRRMPIAMPMLPCLGRDMECPQGSSRKAYVRYTRKQVVATQSNKTVGGGSRYARYTSLARIPNSGFLSSKNLERRYASISGMSMAKLGSHAPEQHGGQKQRQITRGIPSLTSRAMYGGPTGPT
ncbi:hypothetical protein NM208_g1934 [Fusarium decemcellulare]|uniref:Uncharacterized protein n=1 Tax=Fusarium decemcellulare TaxID=57161 RepID=A0ACC1SUB8_9HYPO|nr:hypothetical protein NM208_g1934 [Fusarium decemcellulare]